MAKPEKTECAISLAKFKEKATALKATIGGKEVLIPVKEFATGSFGWYMNEKIMVEIDGKVVAVQIGANLIVVGSKEAARDEKAPVKKAG